ncbi:MAG: LTA synthase family protein [Saprospiraceae bacterium]|nr:LTA synthase family protein [Saprospiraceae bacterium]
MQSDALLFLNGDKGSEGLGMIPVFIIQYWFVWLLFIVITTGLYFMYGVLERFFRSTDLPLELRWKMLPSILIILIMNITGVRGGWQLRPINIINASESVGVINAPAVLNSTFSLLRTWQKKSLTEYTYYSEDVLSDCEKGHHSLNESKDQNKKNVVIIIVESLSKQYISYFGGTAKTVFLDSLMNESMVYSNAFANARESVQGIPAILASIPSLMDEPFIFSRYSTNNINSVASILKPHGYTSAFFHGAAKGTMGFYSFCKSAGFDQYYAKEDYPDNKNDFDGSWGIWDHKYLPYMADELSDMKEPFVASVLTLNSHHPFRLPSEFKGVYKTKGHPILASIRYVDHSLDLFFDKVKKKPWYENTIFIITADHTGPNTDVLKNRLDDYRIPIIIFTPDGSIKGTSDKIAQQTDIMPTILASLNVNTSFFALGKNLLSNQCVPHSINYKMGVYQYIDSSYCLQHNGEKVIGLYHWKKDKYLKRNISYNSSLSPQKKSLEVALKKTIQVYNSTMLHDNMKAK